MTESPRPHRLLIATVGGAPEPVAAALCHWRPEQVIFLASSDSAPFIESHVRPLARGEVVPKLVRPADPEPKPATHEPFDLSTTDYHILHLSNPQDFEACVADIRRGLSGALPSSTQIVADFTGGTKCMSAALGLVARRWNCVFSYVGGDARDKGGVGIVIDGREQVVRRTNPWAALGYQALEDFRDLFNHGQYAAAALLLKQVNMDTRVHPEFLPCKYLALGYDAWEKFRHDEALKALRKVEQEAGALKGVFADAPDLPIAAHVARLEALAPPRLRPGSPSTRPSLPILRDLLANAGRRGAEERYDDAVGRLYRAIEGMAQYRLLERHQISSTSAVPLYRLPEEMRREKEGASGQPQATCKLGLQEAYQLLAALDDELGARFFQIRGLEKDADGTGLAARNSSIFAHGWDPISAGDYARLRETTWALAAELGITEADLVVFPTLGALI